MFRATDTSKTPGCHSRRIKASLLVLMGLVLIGCLFLTVSTATGQEDKPQKVVVTNEELKVTYGPNLPQVVIANQNDGFLPLVLQGVTIGVLVINALLLLMLRGDLKGTSQ